MLNYNVDIDYYQILELASAATLVEMKTAYRKLALKYHPDKGGDEEKFKVLADAYEILMDEETKAAYDRERIIYSPINSGEAASNSNSDKSKCSMANTPPVFSKGTMIFNAATYTRLSSSTSLVERNSTNLVASAGVKAEDMKVDEDMKKKQKKKVALAKNRAQLERIPVNDSSVDPLSIWNLALKYPSFAYQILACKETRALLYISIYSFNLEKLLKNDYNLLLLIASSEALTSNLLYQYGEPNLSGTELHNIHDFHLKNRGSCQAFELLLESNEPFKLLFDNHQILQSINGGYELPQLELLDFTELKKLALKNQAVATMVINNSQLQNKFQYCEEYLINILLAYPALMINFFNNPQRSFYFGNRICSLGCTKSHDFLLYILNSSHEINALHGFDVEKIIESDRKTLEPIASVMVLPDSYTRALTSGFPLPDGCGSVVPGETMTKAEHIYKNKKLKNRHLNYLLFVERLTAPSFSTTKDIYDSIIKNFGEFNEFILVGLIEYLSKTYDHKILAANTVSLMKLFQMNNAYCTYRLAQISLPFFCAIYGTASFPSNCYEYVYKHCNLYFEAFEMLCQDHEALAHMSDEQLYDLQQKWVHTEKSKTTEIFNKNPALMQRWLNGFQIKKLQQGVVVSEYEEQSTLRNESESLVKTREMIASLQHALMFNCITFSEDKYDFISLLLEEDWLLSVVSMQFEDNHILSGLFWLLALTNRPQLLNESLPLDFIIQQIELTLTALMEGKSIEVDWLIERVENETSQTIYHLYTASFQEYLWFVDLLINTNVQQEKDAWIRLLQNKDFCNRIMDNPYSKCLNELTVLNWECPTYQLQALEQNRLINYIVHLVTNYPETDIVRILSTALPIIQDLSAWLTEMSRLDHQKQVDVYLLLLQQGQLTWVDFLQNNKNIALLREFSSLQEYFIAYYSSEVKDELFAMVDSCCKQNLYGDALTIFSLMYQSKLVDSLDDLLPNYPERQRSMGVYPKGLIVLGLAGLLTAISLMMVINLPSILLLSAMAASAVFVMAGTYQLTVNGGDTVVRIRYQDALSRGNVALFFQSEPTLPSDLENSTSAHAPCIIDA